MARTTHKTLTFPLAGVYRRAGYRDQSRPYKAHYGFNVRNEDAIQRRLRGGSRPGLARMANDVFGSIISGLYPVTSVTPGGVQKQTLVVIADGAFSILDGTTITKLSAALLWPGGEEILWGTGDDAIQFSSTVVGAGVLDAVERFGKLYIADAVLQEYDPKTGIVEALQASVGVVPTGCPLVSLYRDRLFLAGSGPSWYCSRQGNPNDWNYGADMGDDGRAVAGQFGLAGKLGTQLTAMIPRADAAMVFASQNELWILRGDPADGQLSQISSEIGVLSPTAWAMAPDGTVAFLSNDGVYLMRAGSAEQPKSWSKERVPDELVNLSSVPGVCTMAYDADSKGFHLFFTPTTGTAENWWLDLESQAMWPVALPTSMQPKATSRVPGASASSFTALGCADGRLRRFSRTATKDDGTAISSGVVIGPVRLTSDDLTDALLAEVHGLMSGEDASVSWYAFTASTPEEAVEGAAKLFDDSTLADGAWASGRNAVSRTRKRGPWVAIALLASGQWAYEAIAVKINLLGRLRYGN